MKRPNAGINQQQKRPKNGLYTKLPGIGKFTTSTMPQIHHPHCPEGKATNKISLSVSAAPGDTVDESSLNKEVEFPLSPEAVLF
jgi:hypothetical protein